MRTSLLPLISALAVGLFSCTLDIGGTTSIPARTGPQFQQAFPDPSSLVSTTDVEGTRKVLDTVPMPETQEHHDALVDALDSVETIDSAHLVLLTEAVAIPTRLGKSNKAKSVTITTVNGRPFFYSRGEGEFAPVVDELLISGAKKLSDPGPASFGALLTVTQSSDAVIDLSDILLEKSDDGSTGALERILGAIPFASVREDLCIEVLLPRDRLKGARADIAIASMSFDSNRTKLIGAIYETLDSLDAETLLRHTKEQSFDSGRTSVVKLGAPLLRSIGGKRALQLVNTASFDSGRQAILSHLISKLELRDASEVMDFIKTNSFDAGRLKMLDTLLDADFPKIHGRDLGKFAKLASFDNGRRELLKNLRPHFRGAITESEASDLLRTLSFDSGRIEVIKLYRDELQALSERARHNVLQAFSMSSSRERAAELLIR